MEASWRGCTLKLDAETFTVELAGQPPVSMALSAVEGFTLLPWPRAQPDARGPSAPDADLFVSWRAQGKLSSLQVPVPHTALQVQLFLERLAQLRPSADLRSMPPAEALAKLGVNTPANRPRRLALAAGIVTTLALAALAAWLSAQA